MKSPSEFHPKDWGQSSKGQGLVSHGAQAGLEFYIIQGRSDPPVAPHSISEVLGTKPSHMLGKRFPNWATSPVPKEISDTFN